MTTSKKIIIQDLLAFLALLFAYLVMTLLLFHRQTVGYGGMYPSDIHPYVAEMEGLNTGYDYPYPRLFLTTCHGSGSYFVEWPDSRCAEILF